MTTFTTEDREAVIQGASGAQYSFMDTSPQAQEVTQIVNGICHQLQALSTVINRMRAELTILKQLADASLLASKFPPTQRTNGEDDCGK